MERVDKKTIIPNGPDHNIFYNALTSNAFKSRVSAGVERIKLLRAESGFSIISNGGEIVYTPLDLGGRHPNEDTYTTDTSIGMEASTNIGLSEVTEYEDYEYNHWPNSKYSVIAAFHFHPLGRPFSNGDIEIYDQFSGGILHGFSTDQNMFFGIFMPQFKNLSITSVRLFMFGGLYNANYYQAEDFNLLSLHRQTEVLKRSGFKVILVNLPVTGSQVNLDPLGKLFN